MTAEELSDLELSGESSDEEDIYNSLPRGYMFEPEDTQEEIKRTRSELLSRIIERTKRTDDRFWYSCEKCD